MYAIQDLEVQLTVNEHPLKHKIELFDAPAIACFSLVNVRGNDALRAAFVLEPLNIRCL
jgi:hypothetical protein